MSRKLTDSHTMKNTINSPYTRFFTETIEVGRMSPFAFFEAGFQKYKEERFYWQNADQTLTLVGIGHAVTLTSDLHEERYKDISNQWNDLCNTLIKEEEDAAPILFGGFSYDPNQVLQSEWNQFPSAYFAVPSFQLKIEDGRSYVSINLVTDKPEASLEFEWLRQERDRLIHLAQVKEFSFQYDNPIVSMEERGKDRYIEAVNNITNLIQAGKADKVVIARSLVLHFEQELSAVAALYAISNEQQESYQFALQHNDCLFFGATPERLIEMKNGKVLSACVAGSIRRGNSAEEDKQLGEALLADPKNREEHHYVVEMISKVFRTHCQQVVVPKNPKLMKIRDIQHLYTPVEGKIASESDIFTLVKALHPTPALGGVPTSAAMEIIRQEEGMDRGYYAAPIGWTDSSGNGEFAVALRSALINGKEAYLYAGGGIVADSNAEDEYDETWVKFRPVLRALGGQLNG